MVQRPEEERTCEQMAESSVLGALALRQAIRLADVAQQTGLGVVVALAALHRLAGAGRVKIIAPLCASADGVDGSRPDRVFFRLVRPRDVQYRWQREIDVRLPVGRLADVVDAEDRAERDGRAAWRVMSVKRHRPRAHNFGRAERRERH